MSDAAKTSVPDKSKTSQNGISASTELRDTLTKLLAAWPGSEGTETKKEAPEAGDAMAMVDLARRRYDGTIRWVLGVFSAVGLLIFGSLPFTDLANVNWLPWAGVGLGLAAAGLAVVIWAATTGLELHDASLAELDQTFADVSGRKRNWWGPKKRANYDLRRSILGPEMLAHLGPGVGNVGGLIQRIGQLDEMVMQTEVGWDGGGSLPEPNQLNRSSIAMGEIHTQLSKEVATALDQLIKLRGQLNHNAAAPESASRKKPAQSDQNDARLRMLVDEQTRRLCSLAGLMPNQSELEQLGRAAALKKTRELYLERREWVLSESLVSQIRATFHVVRGWLMVGAALTALGGIMYAYALANPLDQPPVGSLVAVTVDPGTDAWTALKGCQPPNGKDAIVGVHALLTSSNDADGRQDGPFSATVVDPRCPTQVTVGEGQGSYLPIPPPTS